MQYPLTFIASLGSVVFLATASMASPLTANGPRAILPRAILPRSIQSINECGNNEAKVRQDFVDAAAMANIAVGNLNEESNAYRHYFRTEGDGLIQDIGPVKNMWSSIAANNNPPDEDPKYTFSVRCAEANNTDCKGRTTDSFAITDARPEENGTPRQILICPLYFTDASTKQSSTAHPYTPNPGRRDDSWCQPGNKFKDFSIGGETLLHEMTHLDAVAASAAYPSVHDDDGDFDTHATEDVVGVLPQNNPPLQARNLAAIWQAGNEGSYTDLTEPYRNAESIAASALEFYVMKLCELDNIDV